MLLVPIIQPNGRKELVVCLCTLNDPKRKEHQNAREGEKNYENSKQNHNFPQTIKLNITKWLNIFNIDCCIAFIINFQPLHPRPGFTSPLILLLRLSCHKENHQQQVRTAFDKRKNLNF